MAVKIILKEEITDIPSEVMEFANKIDFNGLNKILSNYLGFKVNLVPGKLKGGSRSYYYNVSMDENLADKCGIMSEIFESVKLDLFNSDIYINKETNKMSFYCTPSFSYSMKKGGFNSLTICAASFTTEKGWRVDL